MPQVHKNYRLVNEDGSIRSRRIGLNRFDVPEIYHALVTISWTRFFLIIVTSYSIVSILFAIIYFISDPDNLRGLVSGHIGGRFIEVFIYSAQIMSTVGGGAISPVGILNNLIQMTESMMALLGMTIITGLLYVRFSKPAANIKYSSKMVMAPYKEGKGLMFRICNVKKNELAEVTVDVFTVKYDPVMRKRIFNHLKLERNSLPFIPITWTIVHPVQKDSPLCNLFHKQEERYWEIAVRVTAIDSINGQTVFSGHSYRKEDIIQNARFLPCDELDEQGETQVYLNRIDNYEVLEEHCASFRQ